MVRIRKLWSKMFVYDTCGTKKVYCMLHFWSQMKYPMHKLLCTNICRDRSRYLNFHSYERMSDVYICMFTCSLCAALQIMECIAPIPIFFAPTLQINFPFRAGFISLNWFSYQFWYDWPILGESAGFNDNELCLFMFLVDVSNAPSHARSTCGWFPSFIIYV